MNIEKFLQDLLASQDLSSEQEAALQAHKKEVTDFLRAEFGADPVVKYAGSHEKGTMISDSYDLDIVCYFPSSDTRTLKEIREDVSSHLKKRYLIEGKTSAERITNLKDGSAPQSYHIDVVPGRFIEGTKDVFIHVDYGDRERMQTNLKKHIDYISIENKECIPAIRLVKIWNCRNNIGIKTFILELFVIWALNGSHNKNNLRVAILETLNAFKDQFGELHLEDPANSNNPISKLISPSHRVMVARAAEEAFNKISGSDNLADWKAVFRENSGESSSTGPTIIRNPSGQWAW